ncbi:hypothetical protein HNP55_000986 [Paucibacter oligotrophus]|uniref:Conserved hypothetical protein CHP02391 domain-containing protein n=1 Tax=Roseateles oligotrophus TaxID=1769250 RepID=A0A840L3T6_9BURK|nr:TIGR02391 family protein [Roseateles oligotrophus]MBB4842471.1 hypothetical protein [Roseateles oligotrophus]
MMLDRNRPAGIQYMGLAGVSKSCMQAVERLLITGTQIEQVMLLTAGQTHALLLQEESLGTVAVKSGFRSGYPGEGPSTLSATLHLLEAFDVDVEEIEVKAVLIERLDDSALTQGDLDDIEKAEPVRPRRWYGYLLPNPRHDDGPVAPIRRLPELMPWGVLDGHLVQAALGFENNPDHALMVGFRQLEDLVRARLGQEVGEGRAFVTAFVGDRSKLTWKKVSAGEHNARSQLFTGAYGAFRNPRAHGMTEGRDVSALQEFMLLNLLYTLERSAIDRPQPTEPDEDAAPAKPKYKRT